MSPQKKRRRTRVLFLCLGNSCRSQMAEALARQFSADIIEPSSAGLIPLGFIAQGTVDALRERGVDSNGQSSKPLRDAQLDATDLLVNLSGRRVENLFAGRKLSVEDWDVGDPYGEDRAVYRRICDEVERRVLELAQSLRAAQRKGRRSRIASD